jgi:hypothetical protein
MIQKIFLSSLLLLSIPTQCLRAQSAGQNSFPFLRHASSARIEALGGSAIAIKDDDAALAWQNPAMLSEKTSGTISINHQRFFGGVQHGYVGYAQHIPKLNMTLHGAVKYVSYGDFAATDEYAVQNGTFSASEQAFTIGVSKQLNEHFSIGTNLKYIHSQLESYKSLGIGIDVSGMYWNPEKRIGVTLVAQNIGRQLGTYFPGQTRYAMPSDLQIGLSKRLKHLPFRVGITYQSLQKWDIRYNNPKVAEESLLGQTDNGPSKTQIIGDNLMRHFVFNGEFLLNKSENLRLRFGYNHRRKKELAVENFRSFGGFSFGFGIKVNRFRIDYARSLYHLAGAGNFFSISTNVKEFKKK